VQQVVTADDLGGWVGEEGEGVTVPGATRAADLGRIDADRDEADAARVELGKTVLQAP
jgi:hypothetical protein